MKRESIKRQEAAGSIEEANRVPGTLHEGNIGLERSKTVLWPGEWIEGLDS